MKIKLLTLKSPDLIGYHWHGFDGFDCIQVDCPYAPNVVIGLDISIPEIKERYDGLKARGLIIKEEDKGLEEVDKMNNEINEANPYFRKMDS